MTPQFSQRLEPLACAAVVLRGRVGASEDVVDLVSSFLDFALPERWSIDRACEKGFGLRMLKRLAVHEASDEASGTASSVDPFYRAYLASKGLVAAINRADDVDVVRWICCEYCPSVVPIKAMCEAARSGRLRVLQWLLDKYPNVRPNAFLVDNAVEGEHLEMLQCMVVSYSLPCFDDGESKLHCAASCGHLEMVQWLHERHVERNWSVKPDELALVSAIANGHFEVAKFLAHRGYPLVQTHDLRVSDSAKSGNLKLIEWLHERQWTQKTYGWINTAAAAGHLHIVEWVHQHIPDDICSTDAMDRAAASGRLDIVQWLHENQAEGCTKMAMDHAAWRGHIDVVQWLHANRNEGCTTLAMDQAAASGHLEIVQWLHEHRSEGCTVIAMEAAAGAGRLDIVQWLHEHRTEGCTHFAMNTAAMNGRLEVVRWLHKHRTEGCTTSAMDYAASRGHLDVVQWLHEHRTEGCTAAAMNMAAASDHLHVVEWLHKNRSEGCSSVAMDRANSQEMLQWLLDHRLGECTNNAMENAARLGKFKKLLLLRERKLDRCTRKAALDALQHDNFEIFQWLRANYPEVRAFEPHFQATTSTQAMMFLEFAK